MASLHIAFWLGIQQDHLTLFPIGSIKYICRHFWEVSCWGRLIFCNAKRTIQMFFGFRVISIFYEISMQQTNKINPAMKVQPSKNPFFTQKNRNGKITKKNVFSPHYHYFTISRLQFNLLNIKIWLQTKT